MSEMVARVTRALQACEPAQIGQRTGQRLARAAIEAMREPTDEMLSAGSAAAEACDEGWETNATWRAMIDVAVNTAEREAR